ncbi:MAG: AAA family ATPase [Paludibacteraceae bacterium]|nr:AAA family ATPase [Paludibacteraceae bacterium]MBQ6724232.1 AAA family ATPase [Paludibacteraceae bacterium]
MEKHLFICLANSFKYGGRCIAGIEIRLSADEKTFRVVDDQGEPRWIRPVQRETTHKEIPMETARNIRILDVIELSNTEACGSGCQNENFYYSRMRIIKSLPFSQKVLQALLSKRDYVLHSQGRFLTHKEYCANKGSLMLIEPEEPEIIREEKFKDGIKKIQYKTRFTYKGNEYLVSVTDPRYLERMEGYSNVPLIGKFPTGTFYYAISMTEEPVEVDGQLQHYKLIAGIIDTRSVEADAQQDARNESLPYYLAEQFAMHTNRPIFITGKAGTGKTTFLRKLREQSPKNMAVVAPTGVAAINAGGMTIHSLFQLPVRTLIPTPQSYRQLFAEQRLTQRKRNMLYHLEMLVIDEISMVRADVLDAIDTVLRRYKYRKDQPFGGVQLVMIGDLFQLSPVVTKGEDEETMKKYYEGPYFFQAKVMKELQPIYVELDHVFRQQDQTFVSLLNEVRENQLTTQGRALLNSRYNPRFKNTDEDFHITLTTHNRSADELNERELNRLPDEPHVFEADIKKDFPANIYPTEEILTLKVGARVMFVRNDDQKPRRFYNGKIGVITDIDDGKIFVRCDDGDIEVTRMVWENIRYREDEKTGKIDEEVLGTFTQYPLRLAWAVTIHKSQGLTFDKVIIDAARAFAAGQVYVALSRCRTLEGIVLSSKLDYVELDNDPSVLRYTDSQPSVETVNQALPKARKEYEVQLFSALFDFHRTLSLVDQMRKVAAKAVSFNAECLPFLEGLQPIFSEWQSIAEKFRPQLTKLLLHGDKSMLRERLQAACLYFLPLLEPVAQQVANHPCRSKNKGDVSDFEPLLNDLFLVLHEKMHLMQSILKTEEPSSESLLQARNNFVAPMADLQPLMEKPQKKTKAPKKEPKPKAPKPVKAPAKNEYKGSALDDMAVEAMIHDMLVEGKPSPFLLDFIKMVKQRRNPAPAPQQRFGERWMVEDDLRLRELFLEGTPIAQLAKEFNRTQGAIRARLKKFGLIE